MYKRQDKKTLNLNQRLYIETIAERFGQLDAKHTISPADNGLKLKFDMGGPPCKREYRKLIGSLIYAVRTRPDVVNIVSELSHFLDCAQSVHYKAGIKVLRYLHTTKTKSLIFNPSGNKGYELMGYVDASYNSDEDNSRSRSGYVIFFHNCPIS